MRTDKHFDAEIIAGITTFLAMSYIMFVNPSILQDIQPAGIHKIGGFDAGAVFIWTCFMAAFASFAAARFLNMPAALAPGMGFNAFVASFASAAGVPWPVLITLCAAASLGVFLLSRFSHFRQNLIAALVESGHIFSAIKGGVGAMLATVALDQTLKFATNSGHRWWTLGLFLLGLGIILAIRLLCEHINAQDDATNTIRTLVNIGKAGGFLLSIGVLLVLIYTLKLSRSSTTIPTHLFITWLDPAVWEETYTFDDFLKAIPFFFAIVFMMAVDLAGSPIDYLQFLSAREGLRPDPSNSLPMIRRSFLVDSVTNIAVAVSGITPVVYYAENHVGWQAGGRTGRTSAIVAWGFLLSGLIGVGFWYWQLPINEFISRFAAMPTLFFVGSWLVADAFANPTALGSFSQFSGDSGDVEVTTDETGLVTPREAPTNEGRILNFLPAAVTTVLATVTTLDNAIAAGILSDAFAFLFPERYRGTRIPPRWELIIVYGGAAFILIWALRVKFLSL